jgi:hypothetical protein
VQLACTSPTSWPNQWRLHSWPIWLLPTPVTKPTCNQSIAPPYHAIFISNDTENKQEKPKPSTPNSHKNLQYFSKADKFIKLKSWKLNKQLAGVCNFLWGQGHRSGYCIYTYCKMEPSVYIEWWCRIQISVWDPQIVCELSDYLLRYVLILKGKIYWPALSTNQA